MRPTPSGRQPHHPRHSLRVKLSAGKMVCACGRIKGLSAHSLETFGHRSWRETHGTPVPKMLPILYNYPREKFS